jgi:predicted RNA binding protein YcfA (HicA-like mRNA interferase family)
MPSPVSYADVERMLRRHGWTLLRISGSHHMWFRRGTGIFPLPVHRGKVKHGYYKELQRLCGEARS